MKAKAHSDSSELAQMVEVLVAKLKPEAIYLFGSRATGTATDDSDYDLLVVLDHLEKPARKYAADAYAALRAMKVSKDVVVTSKERFEGLRNVVNSVEQAAASEGTLLYAR